MPNPKKAISKQQCKATKSAEVKTCSKDETQNTLNDKVMQDDDKNNAPTRKELPPEGSMLASAAVHKAVVILPDGVKHAGEKTFYFYDNDELITFRGYALASTSLANMQQAVGGHIEYAPGKPCAALQKAGYRAMACNEEGMFKFPEQFNADAWAFSGARTKLFGPVILMKKME